MNKHSDRVGELRKMVAQIAAEIGLDASDLLQGEVDALGKRLENVRESISVLADIAEARSNNEIECNKNIDEAKAYLTGMQQVNSNRNSNDFDTKMFYFVYNYRQLLCNRLK